MRTKTNLLHIITELELGGAQKNALYIITHCDNGRYNKFFISAPRGLLVDTAKKIPGVTCCFFPSLKRKINPFADLITLFLLIKFMKTHKIDIVHTHSSKAGILGRWAARLAKVPVIIHTIHGWSFNNHTNVAARYLYIILERAASRVTTCFIAVSEHDIEKGLRYKIGRRSQYALIRYGVDLAQIAALSGQQLNKQDFGVPHSGKVVGMIACLKPQKNPLDFVRLAAAVLTHMPNTYFVLAGDGRLRRAMQNFICRRKLQHQVLLLGWRQDIYRIIPLFDIIVLTSLWEGLPIALLEAMANSKPIVAYDTDGVREIVRDRENGYVVAAQDVQALANRVAALLQNSSQAKQMGRRGYQLLSDNPAFWADKMLARVEGLYQKSLKIN
ncbi:MAG: glycosyltransferase family 4 protein [Candidatus Omnitrophota bacterium]